MCQPAENQRGKGGTRKVLCSVYQRQIKEVAEVNKSYQRLQRAGLKGTEALILQHKSNRTQGLLYQTRGCAKMIQQSNTHQQSVRFRQTYSARTRWLELEVPQSKWETGRDKGRPDPDRQTSSRGRQR